MLSTIHLGVLLCIATLTVAQDLSPPCIKTCYETNPGPSSCRGATDSDGPEMTAEGLARCTCSTFAIYQDDPLYNCLLDCPVDEQTKYLQGWTNTTYGCANRFPDVDEGEVDAARVDQDDVKDDDGGDGSEDDNKQEPSQTEAEGESSQTSSASDSEETDAADAISPALTLAGIAAGSVIIRMVL